MDNAVFENLLTRASVREFTDAPLEREQLEKIVEAGAAAPCAMNVQTRCFAVITDRELIQRLARAVASALGRGSDYDFYAPPAFIIVSDEASNRNAAANCACCLENMMLAAHTLGIGSVWINQLNEACTYPPVSGLLGTLGVPDEHRVYGCLSLGYAAQSVKPKKKSLNVQWH